MAYQSTGYDTGGFQKLEDSKRLGLNLADGLSTTTTVFTRLRRGFQRLSLGKIFFMTAVMLAVNYIFNFHLFVPFVGLVGSATHNDALLYYAFAFLIAALIQRRARYKEFRSGVVWHGFHGGISYFERFTPFIRQEWIYKYVDPAASFSIGWLLRYFGMTGLGYWWMASAVSLAIVEVVTHAKTEEQVWAIHNKRVDADIISGMMGGKGQRSTPARQAHAGTQTDTGLSTGPDEQLARDIAARKRADGLSDEPGRESGQTAREEQERPVQVSAAWLAGILAKMDDATKVKVAIAAVIVIALLFFGNNLRRASAALQTRNALIAKLAQRNNTRPAVATRLVSSNGGELATNLPQAPMPQAPAITATQPPELSAATMPALPLAPGATPFLFAGHWHGGILLPPAHGLCNIAINITANSDSTFSGFSTIGCSPSLTDAGNVSRVDPLRMLAMQAGINPTSAILTSVPGDGAGLHFKVDKNIGVAESHNGCNMTSAEATPFGDRLAFEWHEQGCPGGQIVLSRTK